MRNFQLSIYNFQSFFNEQLINDELGIYYYYAENCKTAKL